MLPKLKQTRLATEICTQLNSLILNGNSESEWKIMILLGGRPAINTFKCNWGDFLFFFFLTIPYKRQHCLCFVYICCVYSWFLACFFFVFIFLLLVTVETTAPWGWFFFKFFVNIFFVFVEAFLLRCVSSGVFCLLVSEKLIVQLLMRISLNLLKYFSSFFFFFVYCWVLFSLFCLQCVFKYAI